MRILLLSYAVIPAFAEAYGHSNYTRSAGWVVGIHEGLLQNNINVALVSPDNSNHSETKKVVNNTTYYAYPSKYKDVAVFNEQQPKTFLAILHDFKPNVVVIFGTEYTQGYAMLLACKEAGLLDSTVIFTQGLISAISRYYVADIPEKVAHHKSVREMINHMDVISQKKAFEARGINEQKIITLAKHIIGGTVWDRNVIHMINPDIEYHYCPEILRDVFYNNKWSIDQCERHSIFTVQSSFYPVKGIHYLLEGFKEVLKKYPDAKLRITLDKPKKARTFKEKVYALTYEDYIASLMDEYRLWGHVTYLGKPDDEQLIQHYLKAHVFVCASSIENHSQTVSEAKIMGIPTIAAFVGGVVERIKHGEDGYLYQHNAPYMIAEYVERIYNDDALALEMSKNASHNASLLVNKEKNISIFIEVCENIQRVYQT